LGKENEFRWNKKLEGGEKGRAATGRVYAVKWGSLEIRICRKRGKTA